MPTAPSSNEALIHIAVDQNGTVSEQDVIIPLSIGGFPPSAATFYITSPTTGQHLQVDLNTAANLLASSAAINDLGYIYVNIASQDLSDWSTILADAYQINGLEWLSGTLADLSGMVLGDLVVPGGGASDAVQTFLSHVATLPASQARLALAAVALNDVMTLLKNAQLEYTTYVDDNLLSSTPVPFRG